MTTIEAKTRKKLESLLWKNTHKDFRGTFAQHGRTMKCILVLRSGGTTLVDLGSLTTEELLSKLPKRLMAQVEETYNREKLTTIRLWAIEGVRFYEVYSLTHNKTVMVFTKEEAEAVR